MSDMTILSYRFWLLFACVHPFLRAESGNILSACEVLENLQKYRGKIVEVRGILTGGTEGTYLKPGPHEDCVKALGVFGYEWRNPAFNITPAGSPLVEDSSLEPHSYTAPVGLSGAAQGETWIIVTARVEARESLTMVHVGSSGRQVPYGYGHLNACPAQLVYSNFRKTDAPTLATGERGK